MTLTGKPVICHICGKNHYANRCPDREDGTQEKKATKAEDTPRAGSPPTKAAPPCVQHPNRLEGDGTVASTMILPKQHTKLDPSACWISTAPCLLKTHPGSFEIQFPIELTYANETPTPIAHRGRIFLVRRMRNNMLFLPIAPINSLQSMNLSTLPSFKLSSVCVKNLYR